MTRKLLLVFAMPVFCVAQSIRNVPASFPTIQSAIAVAATGDVVSVAPGTYVETINFLGKAITVRSTHGAAVTIIDGNNYGTVVTFATGEGRGSVLDGFTVTNGYGAAATSYYFGIGEARPGGIYCFNSSPWVRRCVIAGNTGGGGTTTPFYGSGFGGPGAPGGVFSAVGDLRLSDCVIRDNYGGAGGPAFAGVTGTGFAVGGQGGAGGIALYVGDSLTFSSLIEACVIESNTGGIGGAAMNPLIASVTPGTGGPGALGLVLYTNSRLSIRGTIIRGNLGGNASPPVGTQNAGGGPGGFRCHFSGSHSAPLLQMENCALVGNTGGNGFSSTGLLSVAGAGVANIRGVSLSLTHVTVTRNVAGAPLSGPSSGTGGIAVVPIFGTTLTARNCIIWGNTVDTVPSDLVTSIPFSAEGCNIGVAMPQVSGNGNINVDPLLAGGSAGEFHLQLGSPCLNAGTVGMAPLPAYDIDGDPRVLGGLPDMGCDEREVMPGTREDFTLSLAVNGTVAATVSPSSAVAGNIAVIALSSPLQAHAGYLTLLVGEVYATPLPPTGAVGFPELHVTTNADILRIYPGVGPNGVMFGAVIPVGLGGSAIRLQGLSVTTAARNGFFATTAARDLEF